MTAPASAPKPKPAVLLVDDEPAILELGQLALAGEFEVVTAASAEEAGVLTAQRRFDVIVCDQMMPGQTGVEFLMDLAERQPNIRRILMTGYMNPELLSRAVPLAGLSACLIKPTLPNELKRAIHAALAQK